MSNVEVVAVVALAAVLSGCVDRTDADADWAAKRAVAVNRVRPLVYNTDGCDMLYWPSNLPVSVGNFTDRRLKFVPGTHVTTVSYCPQSAGFGHFTCRKAGEPFVGTVPHPHGGMYNSASKFFALGTDSLQMATEFCATNGLERFVSIRVNDQHDAASRPGNVSALYPQFKLDHPECLMGALDPQSPRRKELYKGYAGWSCVNFDCEIVRERMKAFVRELVANYDVDGIEYDFNRHFMLFRSVATGGVATKDEIAKMTQLMRELKAITEEVGRRKGRPIVIAMRMPDSVDYDLAVGADIVTWFREKLVDIWIGGGYFLLNPLPESVALAHRHGIRFYWSLDETRIPGAAKKKGRPLIPGRMTEAFYAGRYSAAKEAGCDGVYLFNLEYEAFRQMASIDPQNTAGREKVYFALERGSGGYTPNSWVKDGIRFSNLPQIDPNNPLPVKAGETCTFSMFFGDDFGGSASVSVQALTGLKDGQLALTINGRPVAQRSLKNGVATFCPDRDLLHKGSNAFAVTFPSATTFNDFAVRIRPSETRTAPAADVAQDRLNYSSWWAAPGYWRRRIDLKLQEIARARKPFDLVLVGDSITQNWEGWVDEISKSNLLQHIATGRISRAEAHVEPMKNWTLLTNEFSVLNLGISGDDTRHVLWRLTEGRQLDGYKARFFSVMVGTNNTRDRPEDVAKAIARIVRLIRERHPESVVILNPIFPRDERPDAPRRRANEQVNAIISRLADGKHVVWCDFNARLLGPDGVLSREMMSDLLHPCECGYAVWRESLLHYLRSK